MNGNDTRRSVTVRMNFIEKNNWINLKSASFGVVVVRCEFLILHFTFLIPQANCPKTSGGIETERQLRIMN